MSEPPRPISLDAALSPTGSGVPFPRVCVFCGSSPGVSTAYVDAARSVGAHLATAGIGLVYGGGSAGLMGAVAAAALDAGGDVTGVLPVGLFPDGVTETPLRPDHRGTFHLVETEGMHQRKAAMYDLADAFVALPGGLGTLEEVAEVATWAQIGLHVKPVGLLDVEDYWAPLLAWLDASVDAGFLQPSRRALIHHGTAIGPLLHELGASNPDASPKWTAG